MSWLLFLDESGHDHKTMPYEVYGGIAIHASKLWGFIRSMRTLEQSNFGAFLQDFGSEIKGAKLLAKSRFRWEQQGTQLNAQSRRKHALAFLNSSTQGRTPKREEFTAFGQACISVAEEICLLLRSHDARLFAAFTPPMRRPPDVRADVPRKDVVFLLERYYYFLTEQSETGLLVLDRTDKDSDRALVRRIESYFTDTMTGLRRAELVVPAPLFVESDMAYGVQVADFCIYCLNWGYRLPAMDGLVREEVRDFANLLEPLVWHTEVVKPSKRFITHSVFYVPDPYEPRGPTLFDAQQKKEEARPSGPP